MSGRLVPDALWQTIEDLFPPEPSGSDKGGYAGRDNRSVFTVLIFKLKTGIGYRDLPTELGASKKTLRRRIKLWTSHGVFEKIHHRILTQLNAAGALQLAEVLIDGGLVKAPCGGEKNRS